MVYPLDSEFDVLRSCHSDNADGKKIRVDSVTAGGATAANQTSEITQLTAINANTDEIEPRLGSLTETAPGTDTASSGLNGRLQRIAQRLTTILAQLDVALSTRASESTLSTMSNKLTQGTTGTLTTIARSTTSGTALASNANRKGAVFYNDSAGLCFLAYSATVTTAAFTIRVQPQDSHIIDRLGYTGIVSVIFQSAGTGNLLVTEIT